MRSNRQEQMNTTPPDLGTTHFGFQTVPEGDKAGMVHGVFTRVASKYDIMNDLMSAGMHRLWKDAMMDWLTVYKSKRRHATPGQISPVSCQKWVGRGQKAWRISKSGSGRR
jgi:hypothetical protein